MHKDNVIMRLCLNQNRFNTKNSIFALKWFISKCIHTISIKKVNFYYFMLKKYCQKYYEQSYFYLSNNNYYGLTPSYTMDTD